SISVRRYAFTNPLFPIPVNPSGGSRHPAMTAMEDEDEMSPVILNVFSNEDDGVRFAPRQQNHHFGAPITQMGGHYIRAVGRNVVQNPPFNPLPTPKEPHPA